MENKPIITCAGDQQLFSKLHPSLIQALPRESVEWRRSYGRPPRKIYAEASFITYTESVFPPDDDWTLLARPFFHTYWTDCDIDTFKSKVKDDILAWIAALKSHGATDWLIIHVVQDENKVKTKLLRTSVIDKIKNDLCGKNSERCITLHEPFKNETKSAESYIALLSRLRQLLLASYNKNLGRFEENMRTQREKRNEPGWNFFHYFILQEELAFMFEMLGLFEDAMVQYDELDALFTQFVLNHAAGATAQWLSSMAKLGCQTWDGLNLSIPLNTDKRVLIQQRKASLLDFRNYLFSRQATLLLLLYKPWEVAQRSIPYIHNCMQELKMLEIELPEGALNCWTFLNCLEVLSTCEKFSDSGQMETYSLHTASLWDYARQKLMELGDVCGLMPGQAPSSQQLHMVVDLTSGMTQGKGSESSEPLQKLREALSSQESFLKHYLELSELAMGTFKHIGRIRSARMIGQDLAQFYMKQGEPQKAESFWMDALKMYQSEGWQALVDDTRLKVAQCQKLLGDKEKYVTSCCLIASSRCLTRENTQLHLKEMLSLSDKLTETVIQAAEPVFEVKSLKCNEQKFIVNNDIAITLHLHSNLPDAVSCDSISISIADTSETLDQFESSIGSHTSTDNLEKERTRNRSESSLTSAGSVKFFENSKSSNIPLKLDLQPCLNIKGEDGGTYVGIVYKPPSPMENNVSTRQRALEKENHSEAVKAGKVQLKPGLNVVYLQGQMGEVGCYILQQLCVTIGKLEFLHNIDQSEQTSFLVACDSPDIKLCSKSELLLAGVSQEVVFKLNTGSHSVPAGTKLVLSAPDGVAISGPDIEDAAIKLPEAKPYEEIEYPMSVFCSLDDKGTICYEKRICVSSDILDSDEKHLLNFTHPFRLVHKLHTSGRKKFIQLLVHGSSNTDFILSNDKLTSDCSDVELISLNKTSQQLTVNQEQSCSYMWQLKPNITDCPALHCTFTVDYHLKGEKNPKAAKCNLTFTIEDYQTLYAVYTDVIIGNDSAMACAGEQCQFKIKVKAAGQRSSSEERLLYEVPTDNKEWAFSGRTSGVFTVNNTGVYETVLDVLPLNGGYLCQPPVTLFKYQQSEQLNDDDQMSANRGVPQLIPFKRGQIYHASTAKQVHVQPANNTSHVDIAMVTVS